MLGLYYLRPPRGSRRSDDARNPSSPPVTRVFLSGVRSRSHLLYVAAYLRSLDSRGRRIHVVNMGLGEFLGASRVSAADVAAAISTSARVTLDLDGTGASRPVARSEGLVYLAVGAPGIKPYLRLLAACRRRPWCVVVDEGLGSYGSWRSRCSAWRRQGSRGLWPLVRALAVGAARRYLTDERCSLYLPGPQRWRVNERVAAELRTGELRSDAEPARRAVLISQPWVELGQLSRGRYRAVIREVGAACHAAGLSLSVRPHPAESPDHHVGCALLPSDVPAEVDAAVLSASVVLGFSSTALVNLAAVHGRPAARIALPELAAIDARLSGDQHALLDSFLPPPMTASQLAAWLREHVDVGPSELSA